MNEYFVQINRKLPEEVLRAAIGRRLTPDEIDSANEGRSPFILYFVGDDDHAITAAAEALLADLGLTETHTISAICRRMGVQPVLL